MEKLFFHVCAISNPDVSGSRFLLPIFSKAGEERLYVQVVDEGVILEFRPIIVDESELQSHRENLVATVGSPQIIAYRAKDSSVRVGTVNKLRPLLQNEFRRQKENPPIAVQMSSLLELRHALNQSRQVILNCLDDKQSYADSVAREAGWAEIERLIRHDKKELKKFRSTKGCYDFRFGVSGNIFVDVFTDDPIDAVVIEQARTSISQLLSDFFLQGDDADSRGQLELPFREWIIADFSQIHRYARQESRLAILLHHIMLHPDQADSVITTYSDRGSYVNSVAAYLKGEFSSYKALDADSIESIIASAIPVLYDQAPYHAKARMLREVARYLGDSIIISNAVRAQVESSRVKDVTKNASAICAYLS